MTATVVVVRSSGKAVIYYERDGYYHEANARGHMPQMGAATGDDTEAAEDYVTPSREQFQACARVVFIHGLRKDAPAARHHRIGSEHRTSLPSGRDGAGLGFGQTQC